MTGYGKAEVELSQSKLSIEIKSLNSKQMDLGVRLPYAFNAKELELRSMVSKELERGKINVFVNKEAVGESSSIQINKTLAKSLYRQISEIASELELEASEDYISTVMRMPDVIKQTTEEVDEEDWKALQRITIEALKNLDEFRIQEGKTLEEDFSMRIGKIVELLMAVEAFEGARIEKVKERIQQSLNSNIDEGKIDKNRFEQEIIFYLEKLDVTEEKIRLKKHCDYFIESMDEEVISKGKKLGFILQEIGREINTLGSKSNDSEMQKIVVQMKDELEKIKEQALNIL
jgi:uncharacterized protein (TIGR00255 family)